MRVSVLGPKRSRHFIRDIRQTKRKQIAQHYKLFLRRVASSQAPCLPALYDSYGLLLSRKHITLWPRPNRRDVHA